MSRHNKPKALRPDEIQAIVDRADEFRRIICRPLISPYCAHCKALHRLGEAIRLAINETSGAGCALVEPDEFRTFMRGAG